MTRVVAVLGTRPEAIKFAPVLAAFAAQQALRCETIVTGQQADLLRDQLAALDITVHHRLDVMQPGFHPDSANSFQFSFDGSPVRFKVTYPTGARSYSSA